jgi:hypothetical protein
MKKNNSKPIALLGMALLFTMVLQAQSIHFNYTDGTNNSYSLVDVRKITFDSDLMNLHLWDGTVYAWNVSTIGDYQYNESTLNTQEILNNINAWNVCVFPNPLNGTMHLQYTLPKKDAIVISLYDLQGNLIFEENIGDQLAGEQYVTFNTSSILKGSYICRIIGQHHSISKNIIKF